VAARGATAEDRIGARVKTVYVKHADVVVGMVDRQPSEEEIQELSRRRRDRSTNAS